MGVIHQVEETVTPREHVLLQLESFPAHCDPPSLLVDNVVGLEALGVEKRRSRVIEVDPVENQIVWEWQAPTAREFFTRTKGAVQRLPNGNTLVTNADHGEIFEIAPDGDVVWRFVSPMRNAEGKRSTLHRARRFESEFIEDLISKYGANPYEG